MEIALILYFVALGFLGGVTYVIVKAEKWDDLKTFSSFKRMVLGGIIGIVYYLLHSNYSFPDMVMTWVSGYMGTDFIASIIEKLAKKK